MDIALKNTFIELWKKHFGETELPIAFYYSDAPGNVEIIKPSRGWSCLISELNKVRNGRSLCFGPDSIGCFGGKRFLGFAPEIMPNFEYFLSFGIPDKLEGERYKKSPELVKKFMEHQGRFEAPGKYIIFKRWDALEEFDNPEVVIFYARPDVLSGLFTLASYDEDEPSAIFAPFSAGCGTIVQHPFNEKDKSKQKCILGMFDVSARPCVKHDILTFSAPIKKFASMVGNMDESFLITPAWEKVRKRIAKAE
ncbi:MAG: DUF169 domain-containing protein [bacterium]